MRHLVPLVSVLVIAACGGETIVTCDDGPYLTALRAPKVQAPEGLDNLDPLNEIPLPEASPRDSEANTSGCLESPPQILIIE